MLLITPLREHKLSLTKTEKAAVLNGAHQTLVSVSIGDHHHQDAGFRGRIAKKKLHLRLANKMKIVLGLGQFYG